MNNRKAEFTSLLLLITDVIPTQIQQLLSCCLDATLGLNSTTECYFIEHVYGHNQVVLRRLLQNRSMFGRFPLSLVTSLQ